jgi:hypothetical protein
MRLARQVSGIKKQLVLKTKFNYTAFHNNVPNDGIAAKVVVEKNVRIPERFFDNHYKNRRKQ